MYETETLKLEREAGRKRIAAASLAQSDSTGCAVELLTGSATAHPTSYLLRALAEATDILMHRYDYDGDGWERLHCAMENAVVRADEIDEAMKILHGDKQINKGNKTIEYKGWYIEETCCFPRKWKVYKKGNGRDNATYRYHETVAEARATICRKTSGIIHGKPKDEIR